MRPVAAKLRMSFAFDQESKINANSALLMYRPLKRQAFGLRISFEHQRVLLPHFTRAYSMAGVHHLGGAGAIVDSVVNIPVALGGTYGWR